MFYKLLAAAVAVGISFTSGFAYALPLTAISSMLDLEASARADVSVPLVIGSGSDAQGGTINTLLTVANALSNSSSPSALVIANGAVVASWSSASAGQVRFINLGWRTTAVGNGGAGILGDWTYVFSNWDGNKLQVEYDISASGDAFLAGGFIISLVEISGGAPVFHLPPGGSGSGAATFDLGIGDTYAFTIAAGGAAVGGLGTREDLLSGTFTWRAVPEPATLALFGLGLAGLGLVRRKEAA